MFLTLCCWGRQAKCSHSVSGGKGSSECLVLLALLQAPTSMPRLPQDMAQQFAGQEVNLAVVEVARSSRKVVCSVAKAKENDELRQLEVGCGPECRVLNPERWNGHLAKHHN